MPVRVTDEIARQLVRIVRDTARAEILPSFRSLDAARITAKSSMNDLVTSADRAAERRLTREIGALLPDALIIGEEAVSDDPALLDRLGDAALAVILDPIDGTWNYARGLPLFGVNLAVVEAGQTSFGLHHDPVSDAWIEARAGAGAYRCDAAGGRQRLEIAPEAALSAGLMPASPLRQADRARTVLLQQQYARILALGCSCHEYWLLAEGAADFMFTDQVKPWDHAAGVLIYREAGGHVAMLPDGAAYAPTRTEGDLLAARSPRLWQALRDEFSALPRG